MGFHNANLWALEDSGIRVGGGQLVETELYPWKSSKCRYVPSAQTRA